jgi:hypothetical protein
MGDVMSFRDALLQGYIEYSDESCVKIVDKALKGQLSELDFEEEGSVVFGYIISALYTFDRDKFYSLIQPIVDDYKERMVKEEMDGYHAVMRESIHVVK